MDIAWRFSESSFGMMKSPGPQVSSKSSGQAFKSNFLSQSQLSRPFVLFPRHSRSRNHFFRPSLRLQILLWTMSTDPLRLDDFIHRLIYEKGYKTWSSLLKKATKDPEIPSASLRVEHLFPQHPYFPTGLELDTTRLLTVTST